MKTFQVGGWLGLSISAVSLGIATLSSPINAQSCPPYNESIVASVRQRRVPIGNILIKNDYGPNARSGSVKIRLYHSDAPKRIFSSWNFAGGESALLASQDQNLVIGGDWGVQVVFGNGVTSCILPVADIGRFQNGRYVVVATEIYRGFR